MWSLLRSLRMLDQALLGGRAGPRALAFGEGSGHAWIVTVRILPWWLFSRIFFGMQGLREKLIVKIARENKDKRVERN